MARSILSSSHAFPQPPHLLLRDAGAPMPPQHAYVTQDKLIYSGESDVNLGVCGEGGGEHSGYYETIPTN